MDKIVSLCRRRGFVFPSSEIYGGLGSSYDYGHYGVLLKENVKARWLEAMVRERDDIVALDSAIILHPRVWEASGHVGGFTDPLVDCRTCKQRFRADHLADEHECAPEAPSKRPGETSDCDLTEPRQFNLMFETRVGAVEETGSACSSAPRRRRASSSTSRTSPSSRAASRRSGSRRSGSRSATRSRRGTSSSARSSSSRWRWSSSCRRTRRTQWYRYWIDERVAWYVRYGLRQESLRVRPHDADELSHYSSATSDIEYLYPIGWSELEGIANRGNFDLTAARRGVRHEARVGRRGERRALRAAGDRARGGRQPLDARVPLRRLRRGGRRRARAHRAAPPPRRSRRSRSRCCR